GRNVEGQLERAKIDLDAGIDVGAELRIEIDARLDALRLDARREARRDGGIDADIGQSAAAKLRPIAHVVGVDVVVGEGTLHVPQRADRAVAYELPRLQPLRMVGDHE